MNPTKTLSTVLCLVTLAAVGRTQEEAEHAPDAGSVHALAAKARISMRTALAAAQKKVPGRAAAVELEASNEHVAWEVMVVARDGRLHEVMIDAISGKLLSDAEEKDPEDLGQLPGYVAGLKSSRVGLGDLVARAGRYLKGVPVEATMGRDGVGEVVVSNTGQLLVARVNGRGQDLLALGVKRGNQEAGEESEAGEEREGREHGEAAEEHEHGEASEEHEVRGLEVRTAHPGAPGKSGRTVVIKEEKEQGENEKGENEKAENEGHAVREGGGSLRLQLRGKGEEEGEEGEEHGEGQARKPGVAGKGGRMVVIKEENEQGENEKGENEKAENEGHAGREGGGALRLQLRGKGEEESEEGEEHGEGHARKPGIAITGRGIVIFGENEKEEGEEHADEGGAKTLRLRLRAKGGRESGEEQEEGEEGESREHRQDPRQGRRRQSANEEEEEGEEHGHEERAGRRGGEVLRIVILREESEGEESGEHEGRGESAGREGQRTLRVRVRHNSEAEEEEGEEGERRQERQHAKPRTEQRRRNRNEEEEGEERENGENGERGENREVGENRAHGGSRTLRVHGRVVLRVAV
jgi:Peptidase propeptide and YPEB domain